MAKTGCFFLSFFLLFSSVFADTVRPTIEEVLSGILLDSATGKPVCQLGPETLDSGLEQCREEHLEPIQMAVIPLVPLIGRLAVLGLSVTGCSLATHQAATENENALHVETLAETEGKREERENSPRERYPKRWFHFAHGAQFTSSVVAALVGFNLVVQSAAKSALGTLGFFGLGAGMAVSGATATCYILQKRTYEGQDSQN